MKLTAFHYDLKLRHPFGISRGTMTVQPTVIVQLEQEGRFGFGEATTNRYYGVTAESLQQSLTTVKAALLQMDAGNPQQCWNELAAMLAEDMFALCALDQAIWDLHGKLAGKKLCEIWGLDPNTGPQSNYTIGIDTPPRMVEKLKEEPNWPIYKIKVGTPQDVETIKALREVTSAPFRVDANCGWQPDEVVSLATELKALGVEFIEQPLPPEQNDLLPAIVDSCPLPLAADESCCVKEDVARCADYGFGIANIKLVKCGGITPALEMISTAHARGMKAMVGCMTESTVGISAIGHLRPLLDYVDMDGAALLANDIADGVKVINGECHYPETAGSGVALVVEGKELKLD